MEENKRVPRPKVKYEGDEGGQDNPNQSRFFALKTVIVTPYFIIHI